MDESLWKWTIFVDESITVDENSAFMTFILNNLYKLQIKVMWHK
jgi:hypothetical protein